MNDRQLRNYKKYTLILLLVTAGALIVCAAAFSIKQAALAANAKSGDVVTEHYTPKQAASQETPAPQKATPVPSSQEAPADYVVKVYDGKIGVFKTGSEAPVLVSEVEAYLLPEGDIELLQKGIPAATFSEARAILEDYE